VENELAKGILRVDFKDKPDKGSILVDTQVMVIEWPASAAKACFPEGGEESRNEARREILSCRRLMEYHCSLQIMSNKM
jgi:hypothetical protein